MTRPFFSDSFALFPNIHQRGNGGIMREIEIVGGVTKQEAAERLLRHANETGEAACCTFGNVVMTANAG